MTLATHEFIRRWRAGDELGQPAKVLRDRCQRELELSAARPTPTPRRLGRKSRLCASGDHAGFKLWPLIEDPRGWFSLELRRRDPKSGVSFLILPSSHAMAATDLRLLRTPLSPSKRLSFLTATFCSRVGSGAPLRLPLAVRKDVPNGFVCATLNSQSHAGQLS